MITCFMMSHENSQSHAGKRIAQGPAPNQHLLLVQTSPYGLGMRPPKRFAWKPANSVVSTSAPSRRRWFLVSVVDHYSNPFLVWSQKLTSCWGTEHIFMSP